MKLVDILVKVLHAWPDGAEFAVQDSDYLQTVKFAGKDCSAIGRGLLNSNQPNIWQACKWGFDHCADFNHSELAEDHATAKITRAEWQAAVDALKVAEGIADAEAGNITSIEQVQDKWNRRREDRIPLEWKGEGNPPVGCEVEVIRGDCKWIDGDEWMISRTATVMSVFTNSMRYEIAAIQFIDGHCECILAECLVPIRAPEQIAAEERERALIELTTGSSHPELIRWAEHAYDTLGYRKQVKP